MKARITAVACVIAVRLRLPTPVPPYDRGRSLARWAISSNARRTKAPLLPICRFVSRKFNTRRVSGRQGFAALMTLLFLIVYLCMYFESLLLDEIDKCAVPLSNMTELVALEPRAGTPSNCSPPPVRFRYAHKTSSEWRREGRMELLTSDGQTDRGEDGCPCRGVLGGVLSGGAASSSPSAAAPAALPPCGFSHGYAPSANGAIFGGKEDGRNGRRG